MKERKRRRKPQPTPTPAPTPAPAPTPPETFDRGRQLSIPEVLTIARKAGFTNDQLLPVVAIAVAESSLWSAQRNWHPEYGTRPDGSTHCDRGIWQISSHWWPQYTDLQCDTPEICAQIVYIISRAGADFGPWDAYKYGSAQKHYDTALYGWPALRPVVEQWLAQNQGEPT